MCMYTLSTSRCPPSSTDYPVQLSNLEPIVSLPWDIPVINCTVHLTLISIQLMGLVGFDCTKTLDNPV